MIDHKRQKKSAEQFLVWSVRNHAGQHSERVNTMQAANSE